MIFMHRRFLLVILFAGTFPSPVRAQNSEITMTTYLPSSADLDEWRLEDSARIFVGEELYSLIDGGADLYMEYGFQQVVAAKYRKNPESSIHLEIYEMSDDTAAYGIYSITSGTQGNKVRIGNEGTLTTYSLLFWKSHYLVILSVPDTTDETSAGMVKLAGAVDRNIRDKGTKPPLVSRLPEAGLRAVKFMRGPLALSILYTFDTKDIFLVNDGAVGIYPDHTLFLFQYTSDKEAAERWTSAQEVLRAGNRFSGFMKRTDQFTMTDRTGNGLFVTHINDMIAVIVTEPTSNAVDLYEQVAASLRRR